MFESLDDQIKHDTNLETTKTQRILRWTIAFVAALVVLFGLYLGVRLLE